MELDNIEPDYDDFIFVKNCKKEHLYLKRKLRLIIRDPLAKELVGEFDKLPLPHDEWTEKIGKLHHELCNKWNVDMLSTKDQKYRYSLAKLPYDEFVDPEGKYPLVIRNIDRTLEPVKAFTFINTSLGICEAAFPRELYPGDEKIFFGIDLKLIKLNDSKYIKKTVWNYIERYIKKRNQEGKGTRIYNEPQGLLPLYRCKDKTFNNYLKWYDIHTKEKLSFRIIAHIEKIRKNNPQRAEEILKKLKSEKIRWGIPVKGEDAVEKGVKLIYKVIHRTDYSQKKIEPLIDTYNCPKHESGCPASCKYYKNWLGRFNRLMPSI